MTRRLMLITGASAGIGRALANEYAKHGWDLALVARREDRLKDLAEEVKAKYGVDSLVIAADLSEDGAPDAIVKAVEDAGRHVDGLVNNAGAGMNGFFLEQSWEKQCEFIDMMQMSYLRLAYLILPGMAERKFGRIINMSSVSALLPVQGAHTRFSGSLYPAIKSFLIKWSESLRNEHAGDNIHVTALCPGYTLSEFHDVNGARPMISALPGFWIQSAEEVAETGYDAVERNVPVRVPGAWNKTMVALNRLLPDPAFRWVMAQQAKRARRRNEETRAAAE